jgi:hypothetical protein
MGQRWRTAMATPAARNWLALAGALVMPAPYRRID